MKITLDSCSLKYTVTVDAMYIAILDRAADNFVGIIQWSKMLISDWESSQCKDSCVCLCFIFRTRL